MSTCSGTTASPARTDVAARRTTGHGPLALRIGGRDDDDDVGAGLAGDGHADVEDAGVAERRELLRGAESGPSATSDDDRPDDIGPAGASHVGHAGRVVPSAAMGHDDAGIREILAKTEFFADADEATLDTLATSCVERQLVRGDTLFDAGDPPDSLYIVTRGRIAIAIANPIDKRESVVALMEPGDLFGELSMLDDRPRSAMARALEPSGVLAVPFAPVLAMFDAYPQLLWNVTRMLAQRLRTMDEALADSVFLDVTGRTAKRLLELADGSDQFTLPVTQEELAGMVGASRERVNKAIASFIRLGWLDQRDRQYTIVHRDRLELRAR